MESLCRNYDRIYRVEARIIAKHIIIPLFTKSYDYIVHDDVREGERVREKVKERRNKNMMKETQGKERKKYVGTRFVYYPFKKQYNVIINVPLFN